MNPNPLKEYAERWKTGQGDYVSSYDGSIALIECGKEQFSYIYATEGYKERLRELGFSSVDGLENALSSHQRGHYYLVLQKLVMDALRLGTIQTVEYAYKDVYYRLSALFIARREGRAMILMRLNTFDAEREVKMAKEMLENSSALLMTYELVVMIWPESKKVKRIYTANDIPSYDREETIEKSMIKFCENQVDPVDQERYMRFLDFRTMAKRIESTSKKYIQSLFRMRLEKEQSKWYTARVTQVQSKSETIFMLTVQSIQGTLNHKIDVMAEEHPDFL